MPVDTEALTIQNYPAPILRQRATRIDSIDDQVRAVIERMFEIMHEHEGVGLAAPQVGLPWRLFVTDGEAEGPGCPDRAYINPSLKILPGPLEPLEEGCLSLPGLRCEIRRPPMAEITATSPDGDVFMLTSDDFIARVWQHEYDHLNGVLIIDKMSQMDRLATRKLIKEMEAAASQ